jgi:hypothetical protein
MTTKYVKFAPGNEAAAEAYVTFVEAGLSAINPALVPWPRRFPSGLPAPYTAGGLYRDTNGNHVVAWFGPPFMLNGQTVAALTGDAAARGVIGLLVDTADWVQFPEDE